MYYKLLKIKILFLGIFITTVYSGHCLANATWSNNSESDGYNVEQNSQQEVERRYQEDPWFQSYSTKYLIENYNNRYNSMEDVFSVNLSSSDIQSYKTLTLSDQKEVTCLAKNIYFESRNQSKLGQIAVALVTFNRMKAENYPRTVCKVVYERNKLHCAFSWVCQNKNLEKNGFIEVGVWKSILNLSNTLYQQKETMLKNDVTHGAIFFYSGRKKPYWAKAGRVLITARIGDHTFCKYA